jgi:uncharacterized Zn finger protein (UPF0148 family)
MEPDIQIFQLELKYCERCGGLWLRQHRSGGIYCPSCALRMADWPLVRSPRKRRFRRRADPVAAPVCLPDPEGVHL